MKPNGLFSSYDNFGGKRSISLKPNGLFSLTKRSGDNPLIEEMYPMPPEYFYDQYWGMPIGIFNYKRSMKPNGLFSIGKRSNDYEYDVEDIQDGELEDVDELETEDSDEFHMDKREPQFWATRGKRGDMFWATRGKRGQNFWAVRG